MTNSSLYPRTFTVWSDELDGILSPLFFISKPVNKKGFVELKEVALVNPTRKKPVFDNDAIVPYVGLPETNDQQIREIWMRPYKQVRGRNIIRKGDILFARIEPSVFNKKYILVDDLKEHDFAFTSTEFYIVEPKENINPLFLFYMFFVQPVYDQVTGKTTGSTGRRRLDKGAFEKILIPLPTRKIQDKIVSHLQNAYTEKRKKEDEIQKILASIDGYVLGELGISIEGEHERERERVSEAAPETYVIWSDVIEKRLDPMYFHPARLRAVEAIRKSGQKIALLSEIAEFQREIVGKIPESVPYLGLENIASNSGEYMEDGDKESVSSAFVFKRGDVLFPKLRPYLNKVFYADFDGVCSTEFHVLRAQKCQPFYLFAFLSRSIVVAQTSRLMTGNTLPRLQTEDVENLLVPVPSAAKQEKITSGVQSSYSKMRTMRAQAAEVLKSTQKQVEQMILA